jgi:hypothetical protein
VSGPVPGFGDEASWPACDGDPLDPRTPEAADDDEDEAGDDGYAEWSYGDDDDYADRELDDGQYWERCP